MTGEASQATSRPSEVTTNRIKQITVKDGKVSSPTYDPTKGLRTNGVYELRCFFEVRPGHAEALKQACLELVAGRTGDDAAPEVQEGLSQIGLHDQSATLFDNETRLLFTTTFDSDWDPYIDDTARLAGIGKYYNIFKHCEGVPPGLENDLPSAEFVKHLYNATRETAIEYSRSYSGSVREILRAQKVQKAFQQVLDHPDAEKALAHPALKPLLELAAD